jgi:hypothetical protein
MKQLAAGLMDLFATALTARHSLQAIVLWQASLAAHLHRARWPSMHLSWWHHCCPRVHQTVALRESHPCRPTKGDVENEVPPPLVFIRSTQSLDRCHTTKQKKILDRGIEPRSTAFRC